MKRFHVLLLALTVLVAPAVSAEEASPPQFLNIFTAHIQLGHEAQYEAAVKKLWMALKDAGADFPVFASQSGDSPGDYRFVTQLDNMGDMDTQNATFGKAFAANPDLGAELAMHSNGNSSQIIALRPDLSYRPEQPRLADDETQFAHITFLHSRAGQEQGVEAAIKAFGELNRKHGIRDGFGVSQSVTGEGPLYGIRTLARSQADYFTQRDMNDEKLGEEGAAIRAGVGPMLKRISYTWGFRRQDLSYQP